MDTPAPATPNSQGEKETTHRYPVEFRGRGSEYFKIWIVNVLLSILTLYIYSAWAKVRNKRYFYGNTFVDNSSFEYHATGGQILKGRGIAMAILILVGIAGVFFPIAQLIFYVLLMVLIPWILWRSIIFNARMSSYRNVRYGFTKRVGGLYWAMLKCLLLPLLVLAVSAGVLIYSAMQASGSIPEKLNQFSLQNSSGIAFAILPSALLVFILVIPWLHRNISHFALNGYRYGTAKFISKQSTGKYYVYYLGSIAVTIGLYLLFTLPIIVVGYLFKEGIPGLANLDAALENLEGALQPGSPYFTIVIAIVVLAYLLILFIGMVSAAYLRGRLRNHRYGQTVAGHRVKAISKVRTWPFAWLLFTNILLLAITLGLAFPWTRVRLARYLAANTMIVSKGTLDGFVNAEEKRVSSLGDELGEAFDFDFEIGL